MVDPILLLGKALKSKEGKESLKSFSDGMTSMKDIANAGGFADMKGMFDSVQQLMGSPLMVPLQVLIGQIAGGTADATVELMNTMLEQLEKPGVQTVIKGFTDLIIILMEALGTVIGWIGDIADFLFGNPDKFDPNDPATNWKLHETYFENETITTNNATAVYFDPNDPRTHYLAL